MKVKLCNYSNICPIYKGTLTAKDKPGFLLRNVFCSRGEIGWNACKRYQIYKLNIDPPDDLFPGSNDPIDLIISKIK